MLVLTDAQIATMDAESGGYGLIPRGALVISGDRIVWVGAESDLPAEYADAPNRDLNGRLVTPGLIDCHTHIVFGGDRAREFEMRLEGAGYEEISRAGGGIVSSVRATREAGEAELLHSAQRRVDHLLAEGVTTLEINSGYGMYISS